MYTNVKFFQYLPLAKFTTKGTSALSLQFSFQWQQQKKPRTKSIFQTKNSPLTKEARYLLIPNDSWILYESVLFCYFQSTLILMPILFVTLLPLTALCFFCLASYIFNSASGTLSHTYQAPPRRYIQVDFQQDHIMSIASLSCNDVFYIIFPEDPESLSGLKTSSHLILFISCSTICNKQWEQRSSS